jgi:N-glycosylase/DNA lyase
MAGRLQHCKLLLKNILGVGDKVADCICLFGLKKMESYPIDTWVKKIDEYYGEGYIKNKFPECAGIMQQYLFAYVREHGLPESEG